MTKGSFTKFSVTCNSAQAEVSGIKSRCSCFLLKEFTSKSSTKRLLVRLKRAQELEKGEAKVPLWSQFNPSCAEGCREVMIVGLLCLPALFHCGCLNELFWVSFLVQPLPRPIYCSPLRSCLKTKLIFLSEVSLIFPTYLRDHTFHFINVTRKRGVILNLYLEAGEKFQNCKCLLVVGLQIVKRLKQS